MDRHPLQIHITELQDPVSATTGTTFTTLPTTPHNHTTQHTTPHHGNPKRQATNDTKQLLVHGAMRTSQRSLHNAPIFRLLLKVAVNGTHQCDFHIFEGRKPKQDRMKLLICWK